MFVIKIRTKITKQNAQDKKIQKNKITKVDICILSCEIEELTLIDPLMGQ